MMSEAIYREIQRLSAQENKLKKQEIKKAPYLLCIVSMILIGLSVIGGYMCKVLSFEPPGLILITFVSGYIGLIVSPIVVALYYRKDIIDLFRNPISTILEDVKKNTEADERFVEYLTCRDNRALELSLIEIKAERAAFEKRVSLMVGAIDKVGLFPGLVAFFVSFPTIKAIDIDWCSAIACAMLILYFVGFWCHLIMSRMSRHISLMEYALEQKNL